MLGLAWMFSLRNGSLWEECITFSLKAYLKAFRSAASVAHMAAACDIQQTTRADHVAGIRQARRQAGIMHQVPGPGWSLSTALNQYLDLLPKFPTVDARDWCPNQTPRA